MGSTQVAVVNKALGKIGGAGDQINGEAFLTNLNGTDKVTTWVNSCYSPVCQKVITDLAALDCPFRETLKYADLGAEVDTDDLPEIAGWEHAFDLPADCLAVVKQFEEEDDDGEPEADYTYQFEKILNKLGTGWLLLTNNYSNADGDSAYISYVIDQTDETLWSEALIDCVATYLAAELCPVLGKDIKTRFAMLQEYNERAIPEAKRFNMTQLNLTAATVNDYKGGRS